MGMPVKSVIQDCSTRWNSSCYLLERFVETRWPISAVLSDEKVTKKRSDRKLDLTNKKWELAKELLGPLHPIETATIYFSEEKRVSISTVLPILLGITDNLKVLDKDSCVVKEFKQTVQGMF